MAASSGPDLIQNDLILAFDAADNNSFGAQDLPVKDGLALWLDAADDTVFSYSSGTNVSQWKDKSGNSRHFFQSTAGNQPSRSAVVNSRKAIQFTAASSQYLRYNSTIINNSSAGSVFVVWRTSGETQAYSAILDNYHCGANALGAGFQMERSGAGNAYYWGFQQSSCTNAGRNISYPVSYSDNTTYIYSISKDSSNVTAFSNGTSVTLESSPSATWVEDTKGWIIGCWGNGAETFGRFYNGQHCEIIIYNRGLSSSEIKLIHTYLGQKWGILNTDKSIIDLSGNSRNGLLGNGTTTAMPFLDFYNKGTLKFDGSNDYASGFGSSIVPTSSSPYTISTWIYRNRNNVGYEELLAQWTNANSGNSFFFGFNNSNVRFTDNWNNITVSGAGNTNVWMNLVAVYTVSNAYIYLNGVLVATRGSGFSYTGTGPLILGRQGELNAEYFSGNIGNVYIYNRELSAAEILQNYNVQKARFDNTIVQQGLVLNLDAGNPYSYAGSGATWYDVCGNGYNATLYGSPIYTTSNSGGIIFNASTMYGTLPSSGLAFGTGQFAIEVWVYSTTAVTNNIIYASQSSNIAGFIALYYPNGSGFALTDFSAVGVRTTTTHQTAVSQNTWYHVVGVRNSSNQYIVYVNGVASTTNATSGITLTTLAPQIASNPATTGERFTGTIASLRLYTKELSASEVLQNYNATKSRFGL